MRGRRTERRMGIVHAKALPEATESFLFLQGDGQRMSIPLGQDDCVKTEIVQITDEGAAGMPRRTGATYAMGGVAEQTKDGTTGSNGTKWTDDESGVARSQRVETVWRSRQMGASDGVRVGPGESGQ